MIGFTYSRNGSTPLAYYYQRNLQGDVVGIYDTSGTKLVKYNYDAFGNCTIARIPNEDNEDTTNYGLAIVNPIRYRGYYWDSETKWYYLNARYYSPEFRRFISPDDTSYLDPESVNGLNLYCYCGNDPINFVDPSGHMPEWAINLLSGLGIIVGTALFTGAIVASAGAVGALVGVGTAAIGLSTAAVSTAITIGTISTYAVAGGVALLGTSNAIEAFSGGINPVRDYVMGGNQTLYNATNIAFNTLGSIAVFSGMLAPKIFQNIALKFGNPKFSKGIHLGDYINFFDKNGNWNFRIDATTHGYPKYHHNPHYHVLDRDGQGTSVYYIWEIIKKLLGVK